MLRAVWLAGIASLAAVLWLWPGLVNGVPACRISEYPCRNNQCVKLDGYCDGKDDCGDNSDEPKYCTVCNRTYYGDVGKTYSLQLDRPQWGRLPFLCHLTFTANGHSHGDIVQLLFDAFHVGRYEEGALDGCPEGYMQMSELGRPFTGGSWCGHSSGYAVYYSETSTITVSVKVFHAPLQAATPFEFKIRYKFIAQNDAVVRFGSMTSPLERGQVSPGTYCTRQFEECYRKPCKLQSPNFPGMYPRNVTCYWSLRQRTVPTCKHAMVAVKQDSEQKVQMKRSIAASMNRTGRVLRAWQDCTGERDHLIFYDGGSTNDPVLVKYCGGDWLPRVVSRGPEMLVAFHSSPFSVPLHTATPLRGFELDVDIVFADSDSMDYSRDSKKCEFEVNATNPDDEAFVKPRGRSGRVVSPRHTLSPNTTCTYRFRGRPQDLVWIYFTSYSHHPLIVSERAENASVRMSHRNTNSCQSRLRIWDGGGHGDQLSRLIADHCDNELPRLCDHTSLSNQTRVTRPCSHEESYVSSGSEMVMQHHSEEGTALHPSSFRLMYEFVDTRLPGEVWTGRKGEDPPPPNCSRVFRKQKRGDFTSPRNVFLYGRGGANNLSCVYRFEAAVGERVRIMLHNVSFGENSNCYTDSDPHTNRPRCTTLDDMEGRTTELRLFDVPWKDIKLHKACICDNTSFTGVTGSPLTFQSASKVMELQFTISRLNISEDYTDIFFHASYELIRTPDCPRKQRLRGSGGEEEVVWPSRSRQEVYCEGLPWLLEAQPDHSLFVLTWGTLLPLEPNLDDALRCLTKNRMIVYTGKPLRVVRVICPSEPTARQFPLHIFSDEWRSSDVTSPPGAHRPPSLVVEIVNREAGSAAFSWLEISRTKSSLLQQLELPINATGNDSLNLYPHEVECAYKCPELNACISVSLWCDGRNNCPSGYDERESHCGQTGRIFLQFPGGLYAALGCVAAAVSVCVLLLVLALARRGHSEKEKIANGKCPKRAPTEERLLGPNS